MDYNTTADELMRAEAIKQAGPLADGFRYLEPDEPLQELDEYYCCGDWIQNANFKTYGGKQGGCCLYRRREPTQ